VSAGSAAGPTARLGTPPKLPDIEPAVTDTQAEADRAVAALEAVAEFLRRRGAAASGQAADVLVAEAMMACDPALATQVRGLAGAGRPAAWAVSEALASYREMLTSAGGYLAERAADLDDIADRATALLLGEPMPGIPAPGQPFVLLAAELAPADTATLDPAAVLAIVAERGGPTSHTAILAKTIGIPAVVSCPGALSVADGTVVAVDGSAGKFVSIGTNDLSQHTFAADRQAGALAPLLDPWQPALLQLIAMAATAGRTAGKPVGVCGEAASDPLLAVVLAGLGVTSLSMAPPALAEVRAALADQTLARCEAAAAAALATATPAAARAAARATAGG